MKTFSQSTGASSEGKLWHVVVFELMWKQLKNAMRRRKFKEKEVNNNFCNWQFKFNQKSLNFPLKARQKVEDKKFIDFTQKNVFKNKNNLPNQFKVT